MKTQGFGRFYDVCWGELIVADNYEFSRLVLKTAWEDTRAFFGWNIRTLFIIALTALGFGVYYYFQGWEAVKEELLVTVTIVVVPTGAFAFGLMIWNLSIAPFKLVFEGIKNSKNNATPPSKRKPTIKSRLIEASYSVTSVLVDIEEAKGQVSFGLDSSLPPKIESLYIKLKGLGLKTPDIPGNISESGYIFLHEKYLNNILPFMEDGHVKEVKTIAERVSSEAEELMEEFEK